MAAVRTIKPRKIRRPGYRQDPSWADVQDHFSGPIPPVDHMKALRVTGQISNAQRRMYDKDAFQMNPQDVIRALNRARVKFVLMGAHAVNGWTRVERATQDVDVLVQKSHHRKAVQAVHAAFPELVVEEHPVVTRFREFGGPVRIDVMKPAEEVHKAALRTTVLVKLSHKVPTLEMLLACKFAAMVSPNRSRAKKLLDAADFTLVVEHNKEDIKRERVREFGELLFAGGGAELVRLVDDVLAGRTLVF
jgi:hypothetical protein